MKSFFFFFKQKTAYDMLRSLVGSEMCIRDRTMIEAFQSGQDLHKLTASRLAGVPLDQVTKAQRPVSYTHLTLPTIYSV